MQMTVQQFFKQFHDDEACLAHLFAVRFGQGHACPKCERKAQWYRIKAERAYSCQWCGHHLHPTVGTPFEKSRTSLQLWFYAIYLFTTTRHGVSAKELQRQLGVTYKTAWRMGHEIRKHMAAVDGDEPLSGFVEVDETMIGGKEKGKPGRSIGNKTVVMGMMERNGDVMTVVVPDVKRASLHPHILENVEKGTTVYTDALWSYRGIDKFGYSHEFVNHTQKEYVRGGAHVNGIEGYWRNLKAGINSTHVHVSGEYLGQYAKEFEYRFNRRNEPWKMLPELLSVFRQS